MADIAVAIEVGEQRATSGAQPTWRGGPYSEGIVGLIGLGRYFEAARNKRVFCATTALNAALNVASPLGAAGTPPLAIFSPASSSTAAVILRATVHQKLGATPVDNFPVWNFVSNAGITAAGNVTPVAARIDGTSSAMRAYANTALTGGAAFSLLRPFMGCIAGQTGTLASGDVGGYVDDTEGSIIVVPGAAVAVTFDVAGTNITGAVSVVWAEVDWPLP
jgi:hypothetical protein